jgi:hypothetical protein
MLAVGAGAEVEEVAAEEAEEIEMMVTTIPATMLR